MSSQSENAVTSSSTDEQQTQQPPSGGTNVVLEIQDIVIGHRTVTLKETKDGEVGK